MKNLTCPICGTKNSLKEENFTFEVHYNDEKNYITLPSYNCSNCGANIALDHEKENNIALTKASNQARNNFVSKALKNIEKDYDFTTIECCFALPQRTLSKWKNQSKSPSATAAAFISLLNVFPWLTKVAFCEFDKKKAYGLAYMEILKQILGKNNLSDTNTSENYINELNEVLTKENLPAINVNADK